MPSPRVPRVRRLLVLLAGYMTAAASAAVAFVLYGTGRAYFDQSGQPLAQARTLAEIVPEGGAIVGLLLAICLPFAWMPLAVGLALWRRAIGRYRLVGCLVVGMITGVASLVWFGAVVAGIAHAFDKEMVTFLPYAVPMGALGGLVFWAIAVRRDGGVKKTAAPAAGGRAGRENSKTSAERSPR